MKSTPRKKVPISIKKEARRLYEAGMHMVDIALELKLNINTLYKYSSKEKWERGRLADLLYIKEHELLTKEVALVRTKKLSEYRSLTDGIVVMGKNIQISTLKQGLSLKENIAFANHVKAIQTSYALDKELYSILTPIEEIEMQLKNVELEEAKERLEKEAGKGGTVNLDY